VISYTGNPVYVMFAAAGSWIGAFCSVWWLKNQGAVGDAGPRLTRPPGSSGPLN
jgi:hypothetical protein